MVGGFALNSVSIGWSDGSYNNVIDLFTRNRLGHIQVHAKGYLDRPSIYKTIDDYEKVGDAVGEVEGVQAWSPRVYAAALVSVGEKSSGAQIIGISPSRENRATHFDKKVIEGSPLTTSSDHETLLGKGMAHNLHAKIGDSLVIFSQAADGSIANDIYKVVGLVDSGDETYDRMSVYLPLREAQSLFVLDSKVHEIIVIVDYLDEVRDIATAITHKLDDSTLAVAPWQEFASSFYKAMKADKQGAWIMLSIITLVVAIGVLNTVLMTVLERRREYGVLRAIGTSPGEIIRMVLYEVAIMAVISLIVGAALGLLGNYLLSAHGVTLDNPLTYGGVEFTEMRGEINLRSFTIPAVTVFTVALVVSLFPALRAAHVEPAKAMRIH
jgi:ABC-type lipoprotein release transport system permease subunit